MCLESLRKGPERLCLAVLVLSTLLTTTAWSADRKSDTLWLTERAAELLKGCRVPADDGSMLYTPDGKGNYRALWTRDFAYMVENAGDLLPMRDVQICLQHLIDGIRTDGATPDRVRPDGVPVYTGGPEDHPMGEPNIDNAQFLVIAVDEYLKRLPTSSARIPFKAWAPKLGQAMHWIPRAGDGLVWNDPVKPHSPYGFTDTVKKTGGLLFESLLYWTAAQRMAQWHEAVGDKATARTFLREARLVESGLNGLWDSKAGAFFAATRDCRQIDIWGNAYAIWLDFPLKGRREPVLRFLADHREQFIWHGQVRHLLKGDYWQSLFADVAPERYQNGAYWATASGWMVFALSQRDPEAARSMWDDMIQDFRSGDICECINEGYRQLPSYVVSACNPLAVARRLKRNHQLSK
jgi:hypothetical protein